MTYGQTPTNRPNRPDDQRLIHRAVRLMLRYAARGYAIISAVFVVLALCCWAVLAESEQGSLPNAHTLAPGDTHTLALTGLLCLIGAALFAFFAWFLRLLDPPRRTRR